MSLAEENIEEQAVNTVEESVNPSALDELFKERSERKNSKSLDDGTEAPVKQEVPATKKVKDSKPVEKASETNEKDDEGERVVAEKTKDKKPVDTRSDDDEERELEVAKLKKALNDSQKWGHTNNKRLKSVVKIIESLKEQGVLNEDEFYNVNTYLTSDVDEPEFENEKVSSDPLNNLIQIANQRVEDILVIYEDDPLSAKKVQAFKFYVENSSEVERDEILEEVEHLKDSPLKLAKKMFQIGERYYNENYKEIDEAGGLKELMSVKNTEIKRMRKRIDKLEKELLQYNDYDKPVLKMDELGDTLTEGTLTDEPGDVMGSILRERANRKKMAKGY
jgi:hypothetical protein